MEAALLPARRWGARQARAGQSGFALLELAIALALASMVLIWTANRLVHQADDAAGRATGVWLLELKRGLDRMLERHFDSLAEGTPALGEDGLPLYGDLFAPRLSELKAQGHLPAGFPETGAFGQDVVIRVLRDGRCPGEACRIDVLAYTSQPLLAADGLPDMMRLGAAVEATHGYGGWAVESRIGGANFDFPNPPAAGAPAVAPGTLAVWTGYGASDYDLYVRRHDVRDPELEASLTVGGSISAQGDLSAGGYLSVGTAATAGSTCSAALAGLFARGADGGLLQCRGGRWKAPPGAGFGGAYAVAGADGCGAYSSVNPITGKCSCPKGYTPVRVSSDLWGPDGLRTNAYVCVGAG
ncbi:prepilin [Bordetella petrii]|uniref:prepilin n=1 Tax=Bordetella petrii TaxID=94624 RepID=UPI0012DE9C5A|nr:prepilin [Bordetella petrii]